MAKRPALIPQSDVTRFFKAAKAAGFASARITRHPDGRIEIVGENASGTASQTADLSPFEEWKSKNAR